MEGGIDAQFHRAVDIVQGLPKGGPVQTSYDEKLWLYSLYKQATEGDISVSRPGMLDMLGRAKWDYWNKQKGKKKVSAKQEYISALLKILKKHADRPACASHIAELESHLPFKPARRPRARSTSSSSSSSSYHSSQASPPPSPPRYSSYPPPDPSLPVPDAAPNIVYPPALNPSHKSLLSMSQARSPPSELERIPPGSEAGNSRSGRGYGRGVLPYTVASGSRAHSLIGGHTGSTDTYAYGGRSGSIHSLRQGPQVSSSAAGLGFVSQNPGSSDYPLSPQVIHRDYTPAMTATGTPYLDIHQPTPTYPSNPHRRIGTPSTYSAPPINVPATLQQIQTSLLAIHERMNQFERSQAMVLRREERRRTWFWASKDEDELDEAEEAAERERNKPNEGGGREVRTAVGTRVRRRWSLRLVWWLLGLSRRLMVDAGVGLLVGIAVMLLVRGWRGDMGRLVRLRLRGLLEAAQ